MAQDPYCYPGTSVLINKFGVRDQEQLNVREQVTTKKALRDLELNPVKGNFDRQHLMEIHRRIFQDVYPFAGQQRTYNMSKPEPVLSGASVKYGDHKVMDQLLDHDTKELGRFRWDDSNKAQSAAHFTKLISNVWQAHAFREGNTRAIGVFMHQFAKERGFELDRETMWPAASETRDFLAKATVGDGKDFAKRVLQAHQIEKDRNHPELGRVTSMTAQMLRMMGKPEVQIPKKGDELKGQVLTVSYDTAIVANARGVHAVDVKNFPKTPQTNDRVNVAIEHEFTSKSRSEKGAEKSAADKGRSDDKSAPDPKDRGSSDKPEKTIKLAPPESPTKYRSR
ncbi:Fic family protein (plasmid) [Agrobacterium leguminum]|uniref:Fic/DOC family protein n=1 Tax=Agrobacterium leguminum TaxID=2792015 RepID=UPI0010C9F957|nr:Fic family protein [Agrobacterium leguminum]WFS69544.1 Fic family protein [Agrobacterium leguminum]